MQINNFYSGLILILFSGISASYFFWFLKRNSYAKHWKNTEGLMLRSKPKDTLNGFIPDIRYSYTVNQKKYQGTQLYLYAPQSNSRVKIMNQIAHFNEEQIVPVFYDPLNPNNAALNIKVSPFMYIFWISFTTLLVSCGIYMLQH